MHCKGFLKTGKTNSPINVRKERRQFTPWINHISFEFDVLHNNLDELHHSHRLNPEDGITIERSPAGGSGQLWDLGLVRRVGGEVHLPLKKEKLGWSIFIRGEEYDRVNDVTDTGICTSISNQKDAHHNISDLICIDLRSTSGYLY